VLSIILPRKALRHRQSRSGALLSAFAKPPDLGLLTKLLALLAGLSFCELLCCGSDSLSSGYVSLGSDRPKIKLNRADYVPIPQREASMNNCAGSHMRR
jgi:hypothetical protein